MSMRLSTINLVPVLLKFLDLKKIDLFLTNHSEWITAIHLKAPSNRSWWNICCSLHHKLPAHWPLFAQQCRLPNCPFCQWISSSTIPQTSEHLSRTQTCFLSDGTFPKKLTLTQYTSALVQHQSISSRLSTGWLNSMNFCYILADGSLYCLSSLLHFSTLNSIFS